MGKKKKSRQASSDNIVYVVLEGIEYRVKDDEGANKLISLVDMNLPKKRRLKMLDIKGLGLLYYRSVKINFRKKQPAIYRLRFDLARENVRQK